LADIYNVKDYGAIGNDIHDDTAAIQAAINDTFSTGIIFFPPGVYKITSPLRAPNLALSDDSKRRHRMLLYKGCGSNIATGKGSILHANMPDYIYYSLDYPVSVASRNALSFDGLGFWNETTVIPTSTESPSNPTAPGNGSGCLNIQTDIGLSITNCEFKVNKGICLYLYSQNARISHCIFRGGFTLGGGATDSLGALNIETTENCQFYNLGTGVVVAANNGLIVAKDLDFFHCGECMRIGYFPIDWWDVNLHNITAAGNAPAQASYFSNIRMRSFSIYGLYIHGMTYSVLDNLIIDSDGLFGTPLAGLRTASSDLFRVGKISGTYSVAALDCTGGQINFFYNYDVTCSGPGVAYQSRLGPGSGEEPNYFTNCLFDTSQSLASLPSSPAWGQFALFKYVIINDSQELAWSGGSVSNVGGPVQFGGANKVVAFFNGSAWCIAG
jgi:hypothetical protein